MSTRTSRIRASARLTLAVLIAGTALTLGGCVYHGHGGGHRDRGVWGHRHGHHGGHGGHHGGRHDGHGGGHGRH
jgi:hypothetical protein